MHHVSSFATTLGRLCKGLVPALALGLTLVQGAAAQGFRPEQVVQADILHGWQESDGTRIAALRIRLAPGWHTYFRIPGEAGIPPQMDWRGSQNLVAVQPIWPRPSVYEQGGYVSLVYNDTLILPLRLTPQRADRPMALIGNLTLGVCDDICLPVELEVSAGLRGTGTDDAAIRRAMDSAAQSAHSAGIGRVVCSLEPATRGGTLTLRAQLPSLGTGEFIAIEAPGREAYVTRSRTWREGGELVAEAHVRVPRGQPLGINRQALAYTILSDGAMVTGEGCVGG